MTIKPRIGVLFTDGDARKAAAAGSTVRATVFFYKGSSLTCPLSK